MEFPMPQITGYVGRYLGSLQTTQSPFPSTVNFGRFFSICLLKLLFFFFQVNFTMHLLFSWAFPRSLRAFYFLRDESSYINASFCFLY